MSVLCRGVLSSKGLINSLVRLSQCRRPVGNGVQTFAVGRLGRRCVSQFLARGTHSSPPDFNMEPEAKRAKISEGDQSSVVSSASVQDVVSSSTTAAPASMTAAESTAVATSSTEVSADSTATDSAAVASADSGNAAAAGTAAEAAAVAVADGDKGAKIYRRKVAIMMSYCGAHYMGMQRNEGFKTIERELFNALLKSNCSDPNDAIDVQRMQFQRASRTDKGVSAVRQVVSVKIRLFDDALERINKYLPEDIKAFSIIRTTNAFSSHKQATGRAYEYVMPSFALAPSLSKSVSAYRIDDETIQRANRLLALYVGRHNFFNFTSGRKADDVSCFRQIRSFEVKGEPVMDGKWEFITLRVVGQSFMLHQIRKMIGMVLAVMKGCCVEESISSVMVPNPVAVPKVPGLGLLLDEIYFEGYNREYGRDGKHQPLDWSAHKEEIEDFKRKHIVSAIMEEEKRTNQMMIWLHSLRLYEYGKPHDTRVHGYRMPEDGAVSSTAGTCAATSSTTATATSSTAAEATSGSGEQQATPSTSTEAVPSTTDDASAATALTQQAEAASSTTPVEAASSSTV